MAGNVRLNLAQRLQRLETHLAQENPILLNVVKSFRALDGVAYRLGLLDLGDSYANRVPWWPLISVLGTFSSGKSTFINDFLRYKLQLTGNQAVDDKFTVICFSTDAAPRVLPGLALDADPRFPFYNISRDIDAVAHGEGRRVDAYLQLKTCPSEALRGKILIDSPGFDADLQRTSTLRITNHIIDLSDLVLVFFDARHPEPGAMKDTLQHLVTETICRPDSNKFLFVLNQIDSTAREDNPEEVFAAWQRALASAGLTAGRFYRIYNLEAANPIDDDNLRQRFEQKRAVDMAELLGRMQQVEVERCYRIIGVLEKTAKAIQEDFVPRIGAAKRKWKLRVLLLDALVYGIVFSVLLASSISAGWWADASFSPAWLRNLPDPLQIAAAALGIALLVYPHFALRQLAAKTVVKELQREAFSQEIKDSLIRAFKQNTRFTRSLFRTTPAGWGRRAQRGIIRVLSDADRYVESLNDRFANPSGHQPAGSDLRATLPADHEPANERLQRANGIPSLLEIQTASRAADSTRLEQGARIPPADDSDRQRRSARRIIHFEEPPPVRSRE
ncbi:MAG: dynamin family protein [Gammaproteobacteria bacterium]